ncbi:hypothetical protein PFISCL1PPCAC_14971 [Pristionchus fissidentatus]|uniref:Uncharacterized protein n=1 Tax=Pristionchus fissidentatus TaxID=1538716 RepID=A0AAV5VVU3_9BILA|nr:hypothetical protein PFISCL1PPCAC_14971 [Pristionchus fissidentatus]
MLLYESGNVARLWMNGGLDTTLDSIDRRGTIRMLYSREDQELNLLERENSLVVCEWRHELREALHFKSMEMRNLQGQFALCFHKDHTCMLYLKNGALIEIRPDINIGFHTAFKECNPFGTAKKVHWATAIHKDREEYFDSQELAPIVGVSREGTIGVILFHGELGHSSHRRGPNYSSKSWKTGEKLTAVALLASNRGDIDCSEGRFEDKLRVLTVVGTDDGKLLCVNMIVHSHSMIGSEPVHEMIGANREEGREITSIALPHRSEFESGEEGERTEPSELFNYDDGMGAAVRLHGMRFAVAYEDGVIRVFGLVNEGDNSRFDAVFIHEFNCGGRMTIRYDPITPITFIDALINNSLIRYQCEFRLPFSLPQESKDANGFFSMVTHFNKITRKIPYEKEMDERDSISHQILPTNWTALHQFFFDRDNINLKGEWMTLVGSSSGSLSIFPSKDNQISASVHNLHSTRITAISATPLDFDESQREIDMEQFERGNRAFIMPNSNVDKYTDYPPESYLISTVSEDGMVAISVFTHQMLIVLSRSSVVVPSSRSIICLRDGFKHEIRVVVMGDGIETIKFEKKEIVQKLRQIKNELEAE